MTNFEKWSAGLEWPFDSVDEAAELVLDHCHCRLCPANKSCKVEICNSSCRERFCEWARKEADE